MHNLSKAGETFGRCCIGAAMVGFGVQHLVYAEFVTRLVPKLPVWIPGHSWLAWGFGAALVIGGLGVVLRKSARATGLVLGATFLTSFLVRYLPLVAAAPNDVGLCVNAGKALALAGCMFLVAKTAPGNPSRYFSLPAMTNTLEKLIPFGALFLGGFFVFCGILHFIYVNTVADLVPAWVPGHLFWTYFSGIALIAGGVGMNMPPTARAAAGLSALMIFLWVVLLHIPRAMADLRDSNETTAVFEALAIAGGALLVMISSRRTTFKIFPETKPKPRRTPTCAEPQKAGTQNSWVPAAPKNGTYL